MTGGCRPWAGKKLPCWSVLLAWVGRGCPDQPQNSARSILGRPASPRVVALVGPRCGGHREQKVEILAPVGQQDRMCKAGPAGEDVVGRSRAYRCGHDEGCSQNSQESRHTNHDEPTTPVASVAFQPTPARTSARRARRRARARRTPRSPHWCMACGGAGSPPGRRQTCAFAPRLRRADRTHLKATAAMRTHVVENVVDAGGAKRAFVRTDPRVRGTRRQVRIA